MKENEKTWLVTYYSQDFDDNGQIVESVRTTVVDAHELAWYKANDQKSLNDGSWFRIWEVKPYEMG